MAVNGVRAERKGRFLGKCGYAHTHPWATPTGDHAASPCSAGPGTKIAPPASGITSEIFYSTIKLIFMFTVQRIPPPGNAEEGSFNGYALR
ncbi:hypothetical protein Misp01_81270 [Microtetraspora sp. NBRC 13810]|nr:hypothetical protein Misp01_81270 [Microtetraspora sp. NBRC 13810]